METLAEVDSSRKMQEKQCCQEGRCALVEGKSSTCCWLPANQTLLKAIGVDRRKGYLVTVSANNGAGEGEKSTVLTLAR